MSIDQLNEKLIETLRKNGIEKYTAVQEKTIPVIIEGKDIIVQSPTGTGKTLAYVLPLLQSIDASIELPQVVIMAPTRELVMQIFQVVQEYSKSVGIKVASIVGGADVKRQVEKLKGRPQIIVGSPGRIGQLIKMKKLKMHGVKKIVLDEVDELLKTDDQKEIPNIIKATMKDRQLLYFSATITPQAITFAKTQNDQVEELVIEQSLEGNILHGYIPCDDREQLEILRRIGSIPQMKALVFSNDPYKLETYAAKLGFRKIRTAILHSKLGKMERSRVLSDLQSGKISLLFTTDVAARGIDIENLPYVITLDVPEKVEQYTHRSGRVGRMGNKGTVVNLVNAREQKFLFSLKGTQKLKFEPLTVFGGDIVKGEQKPQPNESNKPTSKKIKKK